MISRALRLAAFAPLLLAGCPGPAATPDVQLAAPPAGQGFQLASDSFDVPSGIETQRCYFYQVPDLDHGQPVWVHRVVAAQNPGSHHLSVFRVKTIVNLAPTPDGSPVVDGECFNSGNWADWPLVTNLQNSTPADDVNDWTLPDGVAHKFMPGELLMLQIHYVNATTQKTPGRGHGIVNFWTVDASKVTAELGTVFATDQQIRVCPGDVDKTFETTCTFAKTPVTIVGANGHFHSRGRKFEICSYDKTTGAVSAPFYTSTQWDDPPFLQDLAVTIPANGGIDWRCTYDYARPAAACVSGDGKNDCVPVTNGCDTSATSSC